MSCIKQLGARARRVDVRRAQAYRSHINPWSVFFGLIFGIVGVVAWRRGRAEQEMRPMAAGVALIAYGYFVPNPWLGLVIGLGLTAIAFWP